MDRLRRLSELWSWLPAFRAVAESEHLPTAAESLHVSPSALSRSVRLLEDRVGRALFRREGRRLVLNPEGEILLTAIRRAMRTLDDALDAVSGETFHGHVRVSMPSAFVPVLILPTIERLRETQPDLIPVQSSLPSGAVAGELRRGSLDLAVIDDPAVSDELELEKLAVLTYGVYCAKSHPMARTRGTARTRYEPHAFVAPPPGVPDQWPAERARTIGLRVGTLALGFESCASGQYLAVLPDAVARIEPWSSRLLRLPIEVPTKSSMYAVFRKPVSDRDRVSVFLEALRKVVAERVAQP